MLSQAGDGNAGAIIVFVFVGGLLFGVIGGTIASSKVRWAAGFWCGFLLGPIGLVVAAVLEPSEAVQKTRLSDHAREVAAAAAAIHPNAVSGHPDPNRPLASSVSGQQQPSIPLKTCPWCAEQIQPRAIICRYCGRDV